MSSPGRDNGDLYNRARLHSVPLPCARNKITYYLGSTSKEMQEFISEGACRRNFVNFSAGVTVD